VRYSTILFDLDGTLTDPKVGITRSVQYALDKLGIVEPDADRLDRFIGPPLQYSFQEFYGLDTETAWRGVESYREYFADRGIYENVIYQGIPELLRELAAYGAVLYVATSKPTHFADLIIRHFGIDRHFYKIVGANLDGTRSLKREVVAEIIAADRGPRERMVMIGDRSHDVVGARENALDSIGVTYGYGSRDELSDAGATFIVDSVESLKELLLHA
jgi:phosphoglycolate phosphatase